ncbi:hypothetical protein WKT22_02055 [Candidatus Lokiarchaeum ossiferum]
MVTHMKILLTGAFGNVGLSTLDELLSRGYYVSVFELDTPKNRKLAHHYGDQIDMIWGDLREFTQVEKAVRDVDIILHVGAIIPPLADKFPELAEAVNVGGTKNILQAMAQQPIPPKIVYTSSISVYGDRRQNPLIKTEDPLKPSKHDLYGQQKLKAERLVRHSGLSWCVFRLTYITSMDKLDLDPLMFEMPLETCIEIADTKDVGLALANAVESEDIWGEILNIAGGQACRTTFGEYLIKMLDLFGLGYDRFPANAFSNEEFHCGFMDTQKSQELLHFQRQTLNDYYKEVAKKAKPTRWLAKLFQPIVRAVIVGRSPYYKIKRRKSPARMTIGQYLKQIKRTYLIMKRSIEIEDTITV